MGDTQVETLLPKEMLERFRARSGHFDAENIFFAEDFAELGECGYLAAPVPEPVGGAGLSLTQLVLAQRRLAAYAPATALGVNMHLVWVQAARFLNERNLTSEHEASLDWVLRDAVAGEVFAFGISEAGNESVLMDSGCLAEPMPGGAYVVTGTKIFTTLSPVWTRLGVHAKTPEEGQIIFGFVRREGADNSNLKQGEISHPGSWNPLGMRATQSYTTRLAGVRVEASDVAARIEPYDSSAPLVLAIFSSFSILTAAVYAGIADRALELATEAASAPAPTSGGEFTTRLDDPEVSSKLISAVLDHRTSLDTLEVLARDIDSRLERTDWFVALAAARNRVTDEARRTVDTAMRLVGARGFQADSELARLYRDVLAGMFHPSSSRALAKAVRNSLT